MHYSSPAYNKIKQMGYTKLLEKKHLEITHTKQTPEPTYHSYGPGFELYQDPSISIADHVGSVWGYTSYFGFEKEYRYGMILMRNYNWGTTSWDFGSKVLLRRQVEFERNRKSQVHEEPQHDPAGAPLLNKTVICNRFSRN